MFSGIIDKVGMVEAVDKDGGSLICDVATGYDGLALGESIAVNGVCLTVTEFTPQGQARFYVSPETIQRSNLGALAAGSLVNLERAVAAHTRLSGHIVQGHVDGLAMLKSMHEDSGAKIMRFELPEGLGRYCIEKGSICLNGISLTLNAVEDGPHGTPTISVSIIPHTFEHTNLRTAQPGDKINVEVDMIAKYVERLCQPYQ